MRRNYHTLASQGKVNERKLAEFLAKNGQQVLPMVELIAQSKMAIDDLVDVMGRATIETVLQLSAEQVAGRPQQAPNSQACPCRLRRVIPSACPFRIMFAASIP